MNQKNIKEDDYYAFLGRYMDATTTQSETWSLIRAQFYIYCHLHVATKRLSDVISMVGCNELVY